jgi:hypothetical protein
MESQHVADSGEKYEVGLQDEWPRLETLGRFATYVGIGLYILGLLISNVYLYQIGVSDFSVLRTRFILTGMVAMLIPVPIGLLVFAEFIAIQRVRWFYTSQEGQSQRKSNEFFIALINVTIPIALGLLAISRIAQSGVTFRSPLISSMGMSFDLIFASVFALIFVVIESAVLFQLRRDSESPHHLPGSGLVGMLFLIVALPLFTIFMYIDIFAASIYPIIPEQFGGGKPKEVELVIAESADLLGTAFGMEPGTADPLIRRLDLIWETEQGYVVRDRGAPDSPIFQIDRDIVAVMKFVNAPSFVAASPIPVAATPVALEP